MPPSDIGIAAVLKAELLEDDSSMDQPVGAYYTEYTDYFDSTDQVPKAAYQSLQTMYGASTIEALDRRIISISGAGKKVSSGDIEITCMTQESVKDREGGKWDIPGAESAKVTILIRQPRDIPNADEMFIDRKSVV